MSKIAEGYKQTEVGIIPSDWVVKPIGDTVIISVGRDLKKENYSKDQDSKYKYPVYSNTVSNEGLYGFYNISEYNGESLTVVGRGVGLGTAFKRSGGYSAIGRLLVLIPHKNIDAKYLTEFINYKINIFFESSGVPQLTGISFTKYKVALPPTKAEQTAIATSLNDADALITQLEKLIAKKRNIKQGAMQELLKPKEGWEVKKLGEECERITKGTTPTSVGRDFQSSGINFIKIESLTANGKIIKDKVAFIDTYTNHLLKRSQLKSGDALFSIAGALGRVAIVSDEILPANTNQALAIIRLKKELEIDLKYLFFYLNSNKIQTHISAINVQGAQANLSLQNISDLPIEYPLKTEQTRIAQILSDMDAEIEALGKKLHKYKMLKQGMMQNLLTGKIRLV